MNLHAEYIALFRSAAQAHKLIAHNEESRPAFARLILNIYDPYMPVHEQINEFLQGKGQRLRDPFMLITNYEAGYKNNRGGEVNKLLAGRMIILTQVRKDDFDGEEAALSLTEEIGEQCLSFVEYSSELSENVPLFYFDFDGVETDRLSKLTSRNLFGTAFNFVIQAAGTANTSFNPDNFNL